MKITGWLRNHRSWPKALRLSYARLRLAISKSEEDKAFWRVVLAHGGTLYF